MLPLAGAGLEWYITLKSDETHPSVQLAVNPPPFTLRRVRARFGLDTIRTMLIRYRMCPLYNGTVITTKMCVDLRGLAGEREGIVRDTRRSSSIGLLRSDVITDVHLHYSHLVNSLGQTPDQTTEMVFLFLWGRRRFPSGLVRVETEAARRRNPLNSTAAGRRLSVSHSQGMHSGSYIKGSVPRTQ